MADKNKTKGTKPTEKRKLKLSKEALRRLTSEDLRNVNAGMAPIITDPDTVNACGSIA